MAATDIITPSDLTFSGEEIRTFAEAIITEMGAYAPINEQVEVIEGIVTDRQIAILGHLSKITRKDLGCGLGILDKNIPMSEKFWHPVNLKIWLSQCWEQFEETFMVYYLNVGKEKNDLTNTEIFSNWLVDEISVAAADDATRIAWFGDTAAAITPAGSFSADVAVLDYNMLDGLWKQIFTICTANPKQKTAIAKNAGANYDAQMIFSDAETTAETMTKILLKVWFAADRRLKARPDKMFWVTRSVADQYIAERLSVKNIETPYTRLESGIESLTFMGVPMLVLDQWDEVIQSDQDNGTKFNLPHRILFGVKKNMQVGFDSEAAVKDFKIFFDDMTETSNIRGLYRMDTKVIEDHLLQAAY